MTSKYELEQLLRKETAEVVRRGGHIKTLERLLEVVAPGVLKHYVGPWLTTDYERIKSDIQDYYRTVGPNYLISNYAREEITDDTQD